MGPKTVDFIEYAKNNFSYRFLVPKDKNKVFKVNTIIQSKNVEFFKFIFPRKIYMEKTLSQVELQSNFLQSLDIELRRSKQMRKSTNFGSDIFVFLTENDLKHLRRL